MTWNSAPWLNRSWRWFHSCLGDYQYSKRFFKSRLDCPRSVELQDLPLWLPQIDFTLRDKISNWLPQVGSTWYILRSTETSNSTLSRVIKLQNQILCSTKFFLGDMPLDRIILSEMIGLLPRGVLKSFQYLTLSCSSRIPIMELYLLSDKTFADRKMLIHRMIILMQILR